MAKPLNLADIAKSIFVQDVKDRLNINLAYDGSDNLEYVGWAEPGIADDAGGWFIIKLGYTGSNLTSVKHASGVAGNQYTWDGRTGYF